VKKIALLLSFYLSVNFLIAQDTTSKAAVLVSGNGKNNLVNRGGSGIGVSMNGRLVKIFPSLTDTVQQAGKIVVDITVDKNGNVTDAKYSMAGSTSADTKLIDMAIKAALATKFNETSNEGFQPGKLIFNFKMN
jgi:hypothetical protein